MKQVRQKLVTSYHQSGRKLLLSTREVNEVVSYAVSNGEVLILHFSTTGTSRCQFYTTVSYSDINSPNNLIKNKNQIHCIILKNYP